MKCNKKRSGPTLAKKAPFKGDGVSKGVAICMPKKKKKPRKPYVPSY